MSAQYTQKDVNSKKEEKGAVLDKRACWNCGTELSEKSKFCRECGKNQENRGCRKCGHFSHPESKFCEECGESLTVSRFILSPGSERGSVEDQKDPTPPRRPATGFTRKVHGNLGGKFEEAASGSEIPKEMRIPKLCFNTSPNIPISVNSLL